MKKQTNILLLLSALFISACTPNTSSGETSNPNSDNESIANSDDPTSSDVIDLTNITFKSVEKTTLSEVLEGADTKFFQNEKYDLFFSTNIVNDKAVEVRGILDLNKDVSKRNSSLYVSTSSNIVNHYIKEGRLYSSLKDGDNDKALDYNLDDYFLATKVGLDIFLFNDLFTNTLALLDYAPEANFITIYEGSDVYKVNVDFVSSAVDEWAELVGNVFSDNDKSMDYEMNFYFTNKRLFAVNIDMINDENKKINLDFAQTNDNAKLPEILKDFKDAYVQNHFKFVYHILGEKHVYHADKSGYPSYINFNVPGQKQVDYYLDSTFTTPLNSSGTPKFNKENETDIYVKFTPLSDDVKVVEQINDAPYIKIRRKEAGYRDRQSRDYEKFGEFLVNEYGDIYNLNTNEYYLNNGSGFYYKNKAFSMYFGYGAEVQALTWKKAGTLFVAQNESYLFIYQDDTLSGYSMVADKPDFSLTFTDKTTDYITLKYQSYQNMITNNSKTDNLESFYISSIPSVLNEQLMAELFVAGRFTSGDFNQMTLSDLINKYVRVSTSLENNIFKVVVTSLDGKISKEVSASYLDPTKGKYLHFNGELDTALALNDLTTLPALNGQFVKTDGWLYKQNIKVTTVSELREAIKNDDSNVIELYPNFLQIDGIAYKDYLLSKKIVVESNYVGETSYILDFQNDSLERKGTNYRWIRNGYDVSFFGTGRDYDTPLAKDFYGWQLAIDLIILKENTTNFTVEQSHFGNYDGLYITYTIGSGVELRFMLRSNENSVTIKGNGYSCTVNLS